MAFFEVESIRAAVERIRSKPKDRLRKIKVAYCGNCGQDQEHVYLWYRDVPSEYVSTRICSICGFAPGTNRGIKNKEVRKQVLDADNAECVYCGATENLVMDHIVPHSCGGETVFENLITACRSCNSRRGTKRTPVLRFGRFRK